MECPYCSCKPPVGHGLQLQSLWRVPTAAVSAAAHLRPCGIFRLLEAYIHETAAYAGGVPGGSVWCYRNGLLHPARMRTNAPRQSIAACNTEQQSASSPQVRWHGRTGLVCPRDLDCCHWPADLGTLLLHDPSSCESSENRRKSSRSSRAVAAQAAQAPPPPPPPAAAAAPAAPAPAPAPAAAAADCAEAEPGCNVEGSKNVASNRDIGDDVSVLVVVG